MYRLVRRQVGKFRIKPGKKKKKRVYLANATNLKTIVQKKLD